MEGSALFADAVIGDNFWRSLTLAWTDKLHLGT